jgi:hypothetical protein
MLIPLENLFAEPDEVLLVSPLPVVAPLAQTSDKDRGSAAAAEAPFAVNGGAESDGPLPFPALASNLRRCRGCRPSPPQLPDARIGHSCRGSRKELPVQERIKIRATPENRTAVKGPGRMKLRWSNRVRFALCLHLLHMVSSVEGTSQLLIIWLLQQTPTGWG